MNINISPAKYSSIVEIGETVSKLEKSTGVSYLKLHRGVMDIDTIKLNDIIKSIDFDTKKIQQYGNNDGDPDLIRTIKSKFGLSEHDVIITPGGMATIDLVINSLANQTIWVPEYHWGSWNKILKIHNKTIRTYNDFDIASFKPLYGAVMLCYPSNPTGYYPHINEIRQFIEHCKEKDITVIYDMPYYNLFNNFFDSTVYFPELHYDNVIILSSFSKSLGLSGFRVGYIATKNKDLYDTMHIRSLYKYNSISNIPQQIITLLLNTTSGIEAITEYQYQTRKNIKLNIDYLIEHKLLFNEYPSNPIGPFAIINKTYDELIEHRISSVPLNKFSLSTEIDYIKQFSRISVAVKHELFKEYFDKLK